MGKNIAIFCDGTGNRSPSSQNDEPASNVWRLSQAALNYTDSGWRQVNWYDPGVGTGTSWQSRVLRGIESAARWLAPGFANAARYLYKARMLFELASGVGITENIKQGYEQIVRHYQPGDRIYLFGFSRGAYTARCIAGVISRVGLLRSENVYRVNSVIEHYRKCMPLETTYGRFPLGLDRNSFHSDESVKVALLGLWDTVASLGVPLWGWWFRIGRLWNNASFNTDPAPVCERIRHALAMDERRSQFFVTMFNEKSNGSRNIEQTWFRGAHAGVGGGYADHDLADISLQWMITEAANAGLLLDAKAVARLGAGNRLGRIETELQRQKAWFVAGTWPRWHPCLRETEPGGDGFGRLHDSVYRRAAHANNLRPRGAPLDPEQMVFLDVGGKCNVLVRANHQWNRTGLVIEQGGLYKITYVGGQWQDKDAPICGPDGQTAGWLGVRALFGWARRYNAGKTKWMELIGTVAHPRTWEAREPNLWKLFYYIFFNDPKELTDTLMPLGRGLKQKDDSVYLRHDALNGMLYLFANDLWLFHGNNSGAVELRIERVPAATPCPDGCHVVGTDGRAGCAGPGRPDKVLK